MKLLSSIVLFIGSTAALSLEGVYKFKSEARGTKAIGNFVTADVFISRIIGRTDGYYLGLKNLKLEDSVLDLSPEAFEFTMKNGQIVQVFSDPSENYITKNLKKSIAESLQTSEISDSPHQVLETGGNGIKQVDYITAFENNHKYVQASYSKNSFVSFPENSGLEDKDFDVSARKNTFIDLENDRIMESNTHLKLNFFSQFHRTEVKSDSTIQFILPIDTFSEPASNLVSDDLIHEISLEQRISRLRNALGSHPIDYLNKLLAEGVSKQDFLKMESKLMSLLSIDQESALQVAEKISRDLSHNKVQDSRLFFILSRISSIEAEKILSEKLLASISENNSESIYALLRSLSQMKSISENSPIIEVLKSSSFPEEMKGMAELSLGAISKHLPAEISEKVLSHFQRELETTKCPVRRTHLLHVLGNAKDNSPVHLITSFLEDNHESVRSAAIFGLRNAMHKEDVQDSIANSFSKVENNKQSFINLLKGMKENVPLRRKSGRTTLDSILERANIESPETVEELPEALKNFMKDRMKITSSTNVWNDSSDPLYNFAAPLSQRQQDVDRYPSYEGFINAEMYGPRLANLKFVTGVFSGQATSKGCLAGNFKIFDHLYTETALLGDTHLLADLELFILTFNTQFDSRIYANINGNVIIDFKIVSNCTSGVIPIYDGEIFLIDYSAEFPIDIGNVLVTAQAIAGLEFEAGYKLCLLVINPYVELYLKGRVELIVDLEVLVTIVGLFRGGVSGEVFLNYEIGPETQIGTRNNTGSLTCEACIGIYYGYEAQDASISIWFQRREGLGWGEPTVIPIYEWNDPSVPFPEPLIEECGDI